MKVMITGGTGYFGRLLAGRLKEEFGEGVDVLGVDVRSEEEGEAGGKDMKYVFGDARKKRVEDVFKTEGRIDVVIHLARDRGKDLTTDQLMMTNVYGTFHMLELAKRYDVGLFIYPSSSVVYGAREDNPALIKEDHPLLGNRDIPDIRDRIEADMICQTFAQIGGGNMRVVILRIVPIWRSAGEGILSRYMKGNLVPTFLGFDPMFQIIYEEEVLEAFMLSIKNPESNGAYNIHGQVFLPLLKVIEHLDKKPVPLPEFLVHSNGKFRWSDNLKFDFNYIKYPFVLDGTRARAELGYDPRKKQK